MGGKLLERSFPPDPLSRTLNSPKLRFGQKKGILSLTIPIPRPAQVRGSSDEPHSPLLFCGTTRYTEVNDPTGYHPSPWV